MELRPRNHERFDFLQSYANRIFSSMHPTEVDQVFIHIWALVGQVGNGGFWQFYYNSTGDFAVETVSALECIGATGAAKIVEDWNGFFPKGLPSPNQEQRIRELDNLSNVEEEVEKTENDFYDEEDNIEECLYRYVIENKNRFSQT